HIRVDVHATGLEQHFEPEHIGALGGNPQSIARFLALEGDGQILLTPESELPFRVVLCPRVSIPQVFIGHRIRTEPHLMKDLGNHRHLREVCACFWPAQHDAGPRHTAVKTLKNTVALVVTASSLSYSG